jgi:hypothetical protein
MLYILKTINIGFIVFFIHHRYFEDMLTPLSLTFDSTNETDIIQTFFVVGLWSWSVDKLNVHP